MDLNLLAKEIARLEGKKVPLNIAQIKEVIACLGRVFRSLDPVELTQIVDAITRRAGYKVISRLLTSKKAKR